MLHHHYLQPVRQPAISLQALPVELIPAIIEHIHLSALLKLADRDPVIDGILAETPQLIAHRTWQIYDPQDAAYLYRHPWLSAVRALEFVAVDCIDLVRLLPQVERIVLRNCPIRDEQLEKLPRGLRELQLIRCTQLTNEALESLLRLKELCRLSAAGCMFSSAGLEAIKSLPLTHLDLSRCILIDWSHCHWLFSLKRLHSLNLSHAEGLRTHYLHQLIDNNPQLRQIDLSECQDFTVAQINEFCSKRPGLRITHTARLQDDTVQAVRNYLLSLMVGAAGPQ